MVQTDMSGFTEPKSGQFYVMSWAQLESTRNSSGSRLHRLLTF